MTQRDIISKDMLYRFSDLMQIMDIDDIAAFIADAKGWNDYFTSKYLDEEGFIKEYWVDSDELLYDIATILADFDFKDVYYKGDIALLVCYAKEWQKQ